MTNQLGPGYENLSPEDMSHTMLIAILMHHGGSLDIPAAAFEQDALGGPDGSHHGVQMAPVAGTGAVRLSVVARPEGNDSVLRWEGR